MEVCIIVLLPLDWHHDLMVESQPKYQMLTSLNGKTSNLQATMTMQGPYTEQRNTFKFLNIILNDIPTFLQQGILTNIYLLLTMK